MRRFFLSAAIMAIAAAGPLGAQGGDREIAQQIIEKLKVHRDAGSLKGFTLDLKVDQGVVLLRGNVEQAEQKATVLAAATGIEGIARVVDEIEVRDSGAAPPQSQAQSAIVRPKASVAEVAATEPAAQNAASDPFSFKDALAAAGPALQPSRSGAARGPAPAVHPPMALPYVSPAAGFTGGARAGMVQTVANTESDSARDADAEVTAAVVATLGAAQRQGRLKGFGVDVNTRGGKVMLHGRASSPEQRRLITELVRETPGVVDVMDDIAVIQTPAADTPLQPLPESQGGQEPRRGTPAMVASSRTPSPLPAQTAPYRTDQRVPMNQVSTGMPVLGMVPGMEGYCPPGQAGMQGGYTGMPVPMGPYAGVGAGPRFEQPYLPNYAWPGYAAYPNYAAVSYPQQYSPSAFPYIGPFYPYPQVPLGWRKVTLEWDDGWWYLDFTSR